MTPLTTNQIPAIIVDVDGTLAIRGSRGPYDFDLSEQDLPSAPVVNVVKAILHLGWKVVVITGREEKFRSITERWLKRHLDRYDRLYMRRDGDFRSDAIVKWEIFETQIRNSYDIQFVMDDRNRVVEMWRRELGLTCFQVQDGDF
jgi:hypothetical protein